MTETTPPGDLRFDLITRSAAEIRVSPWEDYLIATQVLGPWLPFREASRREAGEPTGYRNEHTTGYWPDTELPWDRIERLIDLESAGPGRARERVRRFARVVRYIMPEGNRRVGVRRKGEPLYDRDLVGLVLVEVVIWWDAQRPEPVAPEWVGRVPGLPPLEVFDAFGGVLRVAERGLVLGRADPAHAWRHR